MGFRWKREGKSVWHRCAVLIDRLEVRLLLSDLFVSYSLTGSGSAEKWRVTGEHVPFASTGASVQVLVGDNGICTVSGSGRADEITVSSVRNAATDKDEYRIVANSQSWNLTREEVRGFRINGGGGDDVITFKLPVKGKFAELKTTVDGGNGNDKVGGSAGQDRIYGGAGDDTISSGGGGDKIYGDGGNDVINAGSGNDRVCGGDGADQISGGNGRDRIYGEAGKDTCSGGSHNDIIDGGSEDDVLFGGKGDDSISGASGNDELSGNDGDDRLSGNKGNDKCFGGSGSDEMIGGEGEDELIGGQGTNGYDADEGEKTDKQQESTTPGAVFSGAYSVSVAKLEVLISNMNDVHQVIRLPATVGGYSLAVKDFTVQPGASWVVSYSLTGGKLSRGIVSGGTLEVRPRDPSATTVGVSTLFVRGSLMIDPWINDSGAP